MARVLWRRGVGRRLTTRSGIKGWVEGLFKIGAEYRRRSEKLGSECIRLEEITVHAYLRYLILDLKRDGV